MEIGKYVNGLTQKDGIYFSERTSLISYPEKGNEDFFKIEDNSFWFEHRNKCIYMAFKKYAINNLFFDIGGGNGFVAKYLEDRHIESVLVEPGINGCMNAKKRGLNHVICSTLEEANFEKNVLPNVGLFDVVEHIEDDLGFLKMIYNYTEKDGFVFLTVPAYNFLWSNEDVDAGHYKRYTIKTISKCLQLAGFKIEYASYIFSPLPLPIFLTRTLPSVLGFNKKSDDFEKHQNEHKIKKGITQKTMGHFLNKEILKISEGRKSSFGSSCFIIAKK
ncbi:methyltransferase domain-containing protein [Flavobacterium sp. XGLA_31]|uniref:methyltransferase domain-containing protein n=1 Tax=Flavobacterium sp. XGLA_31 TaxID=3447666 RepID=UPI003F2BA543